MPLLNRTHINRPLTNISVAFIQSQDSFVADKVFPNISVENKSDSYFVYNSTQYLTDQVAEVAAGGVAPLIQLTVEAPESYKCKTRKLAAQLPLETVINVDKPLDIEVDTSELLAHKFLINRELNFANNFFTTEKWGIDLVGSDSSDSSTKIKFWDSDESSPIKLISDLKITMKKSTGFDFNTLVVSLPVYKSLLNHREILARILYKGGDNPAIVSRQILASLFELDNIFVMASVYNPGKDGKIDKTKTEFIGGGKSALLCYVPKSAGIKTPASGYTFAWSGLLKQMNGNVDISKIGYGSVGTKRWFDERTSSYFVESWQSYDQRIVGKDLGIFLSNIIK
jgi:hypothetical protein